MMAKRIYTTIAILLLYLPQASAQDIIFTAGDSISLEGIARKHIIKRSERESVIEIAKEFIGKNYVAGTLENSGEPLYISCSSLDCTTFTETVLAIFLAIKENDHSFANICRNLEKIRYRQGTRNGYTSRLHYISWWIDDNGDFAKEVFTGLHTGTQHLMLNFMSTHPDKYKTLKDNRKAVEIIAELEKPYQGIAVKYIPKENVPSLNRTNIKDGDIIAIVTAVEGLDVSHMGFAVWHGENLHMIHASSQEGMVINDAEPLYDYLKKRKSHLGIRVLRVTE